jgi:TfoX/Sxy family transcriptional regulator of competence genes
MDPEKAFGRVMATLGRDPRVGEAKMFGGLGLKVGDKYFMMLYKGQLVVKLPAGRASALVASGDGKYFDPGHGRLMREWIAFAPDLAARWVRLAAEAKGFVAQGSKSAAKSRVKRGPGKTRAGARTKTGR